jgi:hypothetical protein
MLNLNLFSHLFFPFLFLDIPYSMLFIPLSYFFDIHYFRITQRDTVKLVLKKLESYRSSELINGKITGWIVSTKFICKIAYTTDDDGISISNISMITSKRFYDELTSTVNQEQKGIEDHDNSIVFYERSQRYGNINYYDKKLKINQIIPRENQLNIIN